MSRSRTAGWRYGRTSANASLPSTEVAAATARSVPTTSAVVTRTCARSAIIAPSVAATRAPPKSPIAAEPSGRMTSRSPSSWPCATPSSCSSTAARQIPCTTSSSTSCASSDPRPRPVISVTSRASRWVAIPAATIGQDRHARPLGEQRDERLVLHLLEPAEPEAGTFAAVPQRRPERREELAVPRVPAVDLDQELLTVGRTASTRTSATRSVRAARDGGRSPRRPDRRAPSRSDRA